MTKKKNASKTENVEVQVPTLKVTLRGIEVELVIPNDPALFYITAVLCSLSELNNPEVDKVIETFGIYLLDKDGNKIFGENKENIENE